jgi:uncharacterized protein (DUF305 family)
VPIRPNTCDTEGVSVEIDPSPTVDGEPVDGGPADSADTVLPWWQSPLNIIVILLGVLLLAAGAGFVIGERNATPDPTASDIGFLQDMRTHHEQAVGMALTYMGRPGIDVNLATIAQEIAVGQAVDSGRMIQLLREYGKPEANESGIAMAWMNGGVGVPEDRMPGLASMADLDKLANASGKAADTLFVNLMVVHHQAGIVMATYATAHSGTGEVRAFSKSMISSEQEEIVEMQYILNGK